MSMRKWLAAVSGVRKPTSAVYVFDVDESTEIGVRTSFANQPDRIGVRTIDDSPSHEADIVTCDLTRTDKAGFFNDKERLTVMATRARVAFIVIRTKKCTRSHTHLADFFRYVEQRRAYITIRKNNATTT
ncbi:hypothetical protein BKA56DRAFT_667211 [Ilyonectria sp. MPI-CAGE-AT-0026]|nr:hypothetical protein BKA56DRAFT_667211 [Ilyonectria sp. MPI-CAGE-AT-0026]